MKLVFLGVFTKDFFGSGSPEKFIAAYNVKYIDVDSATEYIQNRVPHGNAWRIILKGATVTFPFFNQAAGGDLTGTYPNDEIGAGKVTDPKILSVGWIKVTGTPTTLAGYGITDGLSNILADGKIFVGSAGNLAVAQTMSGDGTISNAGVFTLPVTGVVAGTYGNATNVGQFTVDAKGRVTLAADVSIQITEAQVTNLTTDLAAKLSTALGAGRIFVGDAGNLAAVVSMYGDGSLDNTGLLTIANDAITTIKILDDNVTTGKILNSNVTYAKIQDVSATDMMLGRSTAGAGVVEEIPFTAAARSLVDDATVAAMQATLSVGYSINVQALTSGPTDSQTIYFGTLPKAPVTAQGTSKIYIRKAGVIRIAEIYCYSGTAGSNEAWSLYIRLNNSGDTLIATVSAATNERVFTNSALAIAVVAGDYIEIKGMNPAWSVNPATTIFGGYVYIE